MADQDDPFGDVPAETIPAQPAAEKLTMAEVTKDPGAPEEPILKKELEPALPEPIMVDPVEVKKIAEKEKQAEMILNKLFMKGRMVKVSIGCPEFRKKLTHKDLGKKKEDVPEEIVSLGQKRLIQKSSLAEIKALQSKAYNLIDIHSHESWIPTLRFMKDETALKVKEELLKIKADYQKLATEFIKAYPTLKAETLKKFPEWAAKLEPFYPSDDRVKKSFYFEVAGFDDWRITIVRKEAEVLGDAKLAIKESLMGKLNEFLKSSVLDARTQFLEALETVKAKLDSGEKVNAKTIKKIQDMIEEAKSKNITEDAEFFKMLDGFSKKFTVDAAKEKNFKSEVEKDLADILAAAKDDKAAEKVAEEYVHRSIII